MTDTLPLVVVMGVAGCGKTTIGEAVAAHLGVPFRDGDAFHSEQAVAKMAAGHPLDDDDRKPWLERISSWLAERDQDGAVVACSALKRSYRDLLRSQAPDVVMLHLAGPKPEAARRVASRPGHFMPASLVDSQYATLESLQADERGVTLDFCAPVDSLVADALNALGQPQN